MPNNKKAVKAAKPARKSNNPAGRPKAAVHIAPKSAKPPRRKRVSSIFKSRESAENWIRTKLSKQADDYEFLIDQLKLDLAANGTAMAVFAANDEPTPTELSRSRNAILSSMKTLMSGQQTLMLSLMTKRNLLGDLGGDGEEGGDVTIIVNRLPPEDDDVIEAAPTDGEAPI